MSHYDYVGAGPVQSGWVPTRLQKGDTLLSIARQYQQLVGGDGAFGTAKLIVQGNGVTYSVSAIEGDGGWIQKAGSKTRLVPDGGKITSVTPLGYRWVFDDNTVILLPAGGPRPPAEKKAPTAPDIPPLPRSDVGEAGLPWLAIALGVGSLLLLAGAGKKKSSSSGSGGAKITRWRA